MRNKEVDEAIEHIKRQLESEYIDIYNSYDDEDAFKIVKIAIEQFEKNEDLEQKIRDKIKELYNTEVDRKDFYLNENDVKRRNIDLLEELLEN